ncbi:MAG: V-type ATP synthase subunit E [Candidatus Thorarchaeota archaeon]
MSGISNIIEIINAKTVKKEEKILSEAERHKKIKLEEAKRRADEKASTITKKADLQAKSEISKYEASAKLKSKYRMLEAKDALIKEVLTTVEKRMENIVGKAEYKKVLTRLIVEGCRAISEEKLELILPKGHVSYVDIAAVEKAIAKEIGKKTKLTISKETRRSKGGVIIRTLDNVKWVDNTFENRLERFENTVRDTISKILFESRE